ncbi:MAG: hypothetical protein K2N56_06250, partial [Oscillospiraceae bacterium]|nr:hypothetical protein [Oscillospiraceae bacterium]
MKNNYKSMFDDLAPVMGDEELLKAVLDRKAEKNMGTRKFSKNIFIPVIAAAVLGATAVGASAAYQWNHAQAVQKVFENEGNVDAEFPKYDLNKLGGKELNDVIQCDGFTIKTLGIAADDHTAYMFYDIVFDEGTDLSLSENEKWICTFYPHLELEWIKDYWGLNLENRDELPSPHMSGHSESFGVDGNVLHMYSVFSLSGITLPGKTLNFEFSSLRRYNTVTKESRGDFSVVDNSLAVEVDFVTTESVVVKPDTRVTLPSGETGMFKLIEVTPFTLVTDIDWDNPDSGINNDDMVSTNGKFSVEPITDRLMTSLKIEFKDGTVKDINAFAVDNGSAGGALRLAWEYPVDA